ncbi:hypothetical protein RvY_01788 [Ramazzottius varieornatus]|uniref:Ciliogenesis-associated TTC17-interacting protein N-terminal domain-containing protein n=1 Tax=Ramazzottius varieornatus TaxID=947166 RepID=A0A1D1UIE5_RAMVA|nr:hypothetical protein RvY_01788 [Ramazzottius varieornatus]
MSEVVPPPRPAPVVPIPDYDNFQYATQDAPEYTEHIKSILAKANEKVNARTGFPEKNAFGHRHAAPSVIGAASEEALAYFSHISSECLMQLIQDQTLEVFEGDKVVGSYKVKILRVPADAGKEFFRVTTHLTSQVGGEKVEETHDGVVSENMATVYESYWRLESASTSERKYQFEHQANGKCSVAVLNSYSGEVSSWLNVYPEDQVRGFVSEIAHILLARLLAMEENIPDNFTVLSLNNFGHFRDVTYVKAPIRQIDQRQRERLQHRSSSHGDSALGVNNEEVRAPHALSCYWLPPALPNQRRQPKRWRENMRNLSFD